MKHFRYHLEVAGSFDDENQMTKVVQKILNDLTKEGARNISEGGGKMISFWDPDGPPEGTLARLKYSGTVKISSKGK
jgi:hypothetical protein